MQILHFEVNLFKSCALKNKNKSQVVQLDLQKSALHKLCNKIELNLEKYILSYALKKVSIF